MKSKVFGSTVLALVCSGFLVACPQKSGEESSAKQEPAAGPAGAVVARVGDVDISLSEFEDRMNQQNPLIRARFKSLEQRKKLLENMVEQEAMVQEALRLGLDKDPEMRRGFKKILARYFVNEQFHKKKVQEIDISDEEIAKYYADNQDRYRSEAKRRVHLIFLPAPKADAAKRAEIKKTAEGLLSELKSKPKDRALFLKLAKKHSGDQATRHLGGDTNFKTQKELEETYGKAVAQAAFALAKPNDISDLIETDQGLTLLRHSGQQDAFDHPLDKVKGQIRTTLFAKARGDAYQSFVEGIRTKVGVKMFEEVVEKAKLDESKGDPGQQPGLQMNQGMPGRPGVKQLPSQRGPKNMPPSKMRIPSARPDSKDPKSMPAAAREKLKRPKATRPKAEP